MTRASRGYPHGSGRAFHRVASIPRASTILLAAWLRHRSIARGKKVLANLLEFPVPVIAALNGPTTSTPSMCFLADIVIATPDTVLQDRPHFAIRLRDRNRRRHSFALA